MAMTLIRVTGPSVEPVTIDEIKSVLHIDYDDDDIAITAFIKAARDKIERRCGRVMVQQTWEVRQQDFGTGTVDLPLPSVQSIASVTYIDSAMATQTVDLSDYDLIAGGDDDLSSVIPLQAWPTQDELFPRPDAVRIQFVAGYAPDEEDLVANVPEGLKQAIRWLVGHMVNNRESVVVADTRQAITELPDSVETIIAPYIIPRL